MSALPFHPAVAPGDTEVTRLARHIRALIFGKGQNGGDPAAFGLLQRRYAPGAFSNIVRS